MLLTARDLQRTYRVGRTEVHALRGVNFEVANGEFVAIIGVSGSGKSTLLHVLGCLDRPSAGTYHLDGVPTESLGDTELSRLRSRKIGFVFQAFNLIPQHDVLENVELPLVYQGVPRDVRRARSLAMLDRLGLGNRTHHRPTELSGGQVQRVAIARALVASPAILLADEPTGNLDSETGETIMGLFQDLHRTGMTIVLVTHNRELSARADRVVEIRDGRLVREFQPAGPSLAA